MNSSATSLIVAAHTQSLTVATAESLTGGLLCATLVDVPGASQVIRGGVVTYQLQLKHELLGVDWDFLQQHGPYNERTAIDMALGVRERCGADVGISTTGVAGPGPDGQTPAGTYFVAVALREQCVTKKGVCSGNRQAVRLAAVNAAISLTLGELMKSSAG